nr:MAG TPA: hypothetical protein [Caudoviricetes sp.]
MVETNEVGRYRLVSINNNSELRAFVEKVAKMNLYEWDNELVEYLPSDLPNKAKVLLRREEGK